MLRINRVDEPGGRITLKVEGAIVAALAAFLESECSSLLRPGAAVSLDLACVDLVDREGAATLGRLDRTGVEIRCRPGVVASVLEAEGVRITFLPGDDRDDDCGGVWRHRSHDASGKRGGASSG